MVAEPFSVLASVEPVEVAAFVISSAVDLRTEATPSRDFAVASPEDASEMASKKSIVALEVS